MSNQKRCPFRAYTDNDGNTSTFGLCYEDACPYYDHNNSYRFSDKSYCKKVQMDLTRETKFLEQFGRFSE